MFLKQRLLTFSCPKVSVHIGTCKFRLSVIGLTFLLYLLWVFMPTLCVKAWMPNLDLNSVAIWRKPVTQHALQQSATPIDMIKVYVSNMCCHQTSYSLWGLSCCLLVLSRAVFGQNLNFYNDNFPVILPCRFANPAIFNSTRYNFCSWNIVF